MNKETKKSNVFEYRAEVKQLLHLIVHSMYTHPEVFLRELISNASDALNKVRFRLLTEKENILNPDAPLEIKIDIDSKNQTFSIEDNGLGMTKDTLINDLGTIARSGTLEFLKKLKEQNKKADESLIGRFGLGFYSIFMVTSHATVETRFADKDSSSWIWESSGEGTFEIKEGRRKTRGTKISFKLKDSAKEFTQEEKIKSVINKYSNFAEFPILLNGKKVNKIKALWQKNKEDVTEKELNEFYKFITNHPTEPLGHLHLSLEGSVNFKALLFIPQTAPTDLMQLQNEKSLQLYSENILIQDDCKELLPEYLRFVKGVVESKDLPLNVSREVTQHGPAMAKIKSILTKKILSLLSSWAEKDPKKYKKFYTNFGPLFKTGINIDFENRDKIISLLRFQTSSTKQDEVISLKDYVSRMNKEQKEIYYLSGDKKTNLKKNPNLEYFKKNDIEVIFLTDPVDIFIVPSIGEFEKKPIKSIEKADIDLKPEDNIEKPEASLDKSLLSLFKETLSDKVSDVTVSKRLVDSPATLVTGKDSMDPQMEKMMQMMNKDFNKSKKTMEINVNHPLIRNLSKMHMLDSKNPLIKDCILQLYEGALFIDGNLSSPTDFVKRMHQIMEKATGEETS